MSTPEDFVAYILDQLSFLDSVQTARMFGGVLLKVQGAQLGVILGDMLYLKVTSSKLQQKMQQLGSVQFSYRRKDKPDPVVIKQWWSVPEEFLEDRERLVGLVQEVFLAEK